MPKLKCQYFGHLIWRADSLENTLMLEKIEGRRRRGRQRRRWLDAIITSMDMGLSKLRDTVKDREAWCAAVYSVTKSQTPLRDWTNNMHSTSLHKHLWRSFKNYTRKEGGAVILRELGGGCWHRQQVTAFGRMVLSSGFQLLGVNSRMLTNAGQVTVSGEERISLRMANSIFGYVVKALINLKQLTFSLKKKNMF